MLVLQEAFELQEGNVPHAAAGFGGGIARAQDVCGALTGAVIGLGFYFGREIPEHKEMRDKVYSVVRELYRSFGQHCGAIDCRTLTQTDFSDPEQYAAFQKGTAKADICTPCVNFAVRKTIELVEA